MISAHDDIGLGDLVDVLYSDTWIRGRWDGLVRCNGDLHACLLNASGVAVDAETGEVTRWNSQGCRFVAADVNRVMVLERAVT